MTNRMIISFVMGVILTFLITINIPALRYKTKIEYTVLKDTVRQVDTVVQYIDREVPVIHTRIIRKPKIVYVDSAGFNTYSDSVKIEPEFYLFYKAAINGTLENISLNYYDNRPVRLSTVFDTQTYTETKIVQPRGFYGGLMVGLDNVSPSVMYLRKKNLFLVGYNVVGGRMTFGYGRKF